MQQRHSLHNLIIVLASLIYALTTGIDVMVGGRYLIKFLMMLVLLGVLRRILAVVQFDNGVDIAGGVTVRLVEDHVDPDHSQNEDGDSGDDDGGEDPVVLQDAGHILLVLVSLLGLVDEHYWLLDDVTHTVLIHQRQALRKVDVVDVEHLLCDHRHLSCCGCR